MTGKILHDFASKHVALTSWHKFRNREDIVAPASHSYDSHDRQTASGDIVPRSTYDLSPGDIIQSLENQLKAMHEAFALQEKALEANGQEASKYAFGLNQRLYHQQISSAATSVRIQLPTSTAPTTTAALSAETSQTRRQQEMELLQKFPYYRLLQMWRQKALACLVRSAFLEQRTEQLYKDVRRDRDLQQAQRQEMEIQVLKWKTKSHAVEEQARTLSEQLTVKLQQMQEVSKREATSTQQLHASQSTLRTLARYLDHFRHEADRSSLQQQSIVQQSLQQLDDYANRLEHMRAQVTLLAEELHHRELSLRNSQAAVEAERRLQQARYARQLVHDLELQRLEAQDYAALSPSASAGVSTDANTTPKHQLLQQHQPLQSQSRRSRAKYLSDILLSVEAEGLLKTLFRTLDTSDRGYISVRLLLLSLVEEDSWRLFASRQWEIISAEDFTAMGQLALQALSREVLEVLVSSLLHELQQQQQQQQHDNSGSSGHRRHVNVVDEHEEREGLRSAEAHQHEGDEDRVDDMHEASDDEADVEITWGELLLHLIPTVSEEDEGGSHDPLMPRIAFRSPLSRRELRDLQEQGLVEAFHVGLLPLQLPPLSKAPATHEHSQRKSSSSQIPAASTVVTMQKKLTASTLQRPNHSRNTAIQRHVPAAEEVAISPEHWMQERRVLLQRIQDLTRQSTRTAEGVRAYYDSELRLTALKELRLQQTLQEAQERQQVLQERLQVSEEQARHWQSKYDQRLQVLSEENDALRTQLQARKQDEITRYEGLLEEQTKKLQRLEQEHQLLQRAHSQKEVKLKAQQRDLLRLQSNQVVHAEEVERLKAAVVDSDAQHRAFVERMTQEHAVQQRSWEEERHQLLARLATTQEELIESTKAKALLEEALAAAEQRQQLQQQESQSKQQVDQVVEPPADPLPRSLLSVADVNNGLLSGIPPQQQRHPAVALPTSTHADRPHSLYQHHQQPHQHQLQYHEGAAGAASVPPAPEDGRDGRDGGSTAPAPSSSVSLRSAWGRDPSNKATLDRLLRMVETQLHAE